MRNTATKNELAAALLWLRNHYDVDNETPEKTEVLRVIDLILEDGPVVAITDMRVFRIRYPSTVTYPREKR